FFYLQVSAEYVIKTEENLRQYRQECVAELQVPDEHVQQFRNRQFPNDSITQCYLKCIFNKFQLFDDETGFNVESIHQQLQGAQVAPPGNADHDDALHDKIAACVDSNEQGSSACEWAYRGSVCGMKANLQFIKTN
ncbi:general odorant-binding protein 99a-like, partial [Rhagoletis pomonella]|uniref:general odorant-binding protein 99a-like n=1 Tax=Rhagoletis pomonella TaxID=28610 RepID=UPI001781111A